MADLDEFKLAALAREMTMAIRTYEAIFADFGIDENDYYEIEKLEFYKKAKDRFSLEWNSSLSTPERVKHINAFYFEQLMPKLVARARSGNEPLAAVTDVAKLLARSAGIGEPKQNEMVAGEKFVITINLGADTEVYEKELGKAPVIELEDKRNGQTDNESP